MGVAVLVGLVAASERYAPRLFRGGTHRALYDCPRCDMRYPAGAITDLRFQRCPQGHDISEVEAQTGSASLVVLWACLGFLGIGAVLLALGIVPQP